MPGAALMTTTWRWRYRPSPACNRAHTVCLRGPRASSPRTPRVRQWAFGSGRPSCSFWLVSGQRSDCAAAPRSPGRSADADVSPEGRGRVGSPVDRGLRPARDQSRAGVAMLSGTVPWRGDRYDDVLSRHPQSSERSGFRSMSASPLAGDDKLAERFASGDEEALRTAYAKWSPLVYTLAARSLGNRLDAEDVTQQVFIAAWNSRERYDPTRAPLQSWLVGITRHRIADAHEARAKTSR